MNIHAHSGHRKDWVKLFFEIGLKKPAVLQFDNFEVKADILPGLKHSPTIFRSAGGVASVMATRQPRRVIIAISTYYVETITKLELLAKFISGRYSLTLEINGYYDMVTDVILDPNLGVILGVPVPIGTLPNVGVPVMINGSGPVVMTQDQYDSWGAKPGKLIVEVPFQMRSVIEHDSSWSLVGQSRAVGPRRNEVISLTFHESVSLGLPSAGIIVIDPGDTGVLDPELPN